MAKIKSPITLLKEGIQKCNWELVCEAYQGLTGKKVKMSAVVAEVPDEIIFERAGSYLLSLARKDETGSFGDFTEDDEEQENSDQESEDDQEDGIEEVVPEDSIKVSVGPNRNPPKKYTRDFGFVTLGPKEGEESGGYSKERDKKLYKEKPVARDRPEFKEVKVNCTGCGRDFMTNPAHITKSDGTYVCNGCASARRGLA